MTPDDLAQHMRVAQGLGQPRMTHEGLEALTAYFTCLRLGEEQAPQVGRPWHRRGWNLGACLRAPPPDPGTPIPTDGAAEPGTCGGCLCPSVPSCRDPAGARRRRGHRADGGASGSHGDDGFFGGEQGSCLTARCSSSVMIQDSIVSMSREPETNVLSPLVVEPHPHPYRGCWPCAGRSGGRPGWWTAGPSTPA